jgi:hypothetical protein
VSLERSRDPYFKLFLVSLGALFVHGYHLGTDDSAIYVPAIKRAFDPQLYPFGAGFFEHHGRLSIFSSLVSETAKIGHLPINLAIFLWHILGLFLIALAAWRLASLCFESSRARWSAVLLLTAVLAVPVAGTALVIMDPYVTARSLSTPATMLAIAGFLAHRRKEATLWLMLTALVHPQNAAYTVAFFVLLALPIPGLASAEAIPAYAAFTDRLPTGFDFQPSQGVYHNVLYMRTFFFAQLWEWYEWVGVVAPLIILVWFSRISPRGTLPAFRRISRSLVPFGLIVTAIFLIISSTSRLESFVRLQPMRGFLIVYVLFFILLGGLIGEYALKARAWRWIALFLPLISGMFLMQRLVFTHSQHIEWPWAKPKNQWVAAFEWVRTNTPKNAVFALDPKYIVLSDVDQHGFRAIAERSALSDYYKDSGAVSLFPMLADEWGREQDAQAGWQSFQAADFERLAQKYPVTWVVVKQPAVAGLDCPYTNPSVSVCRIPAPPAQN